MIVGWWLFENIIRLLLYLPTDILILHIPTLMFQLGKNSVKNCLTNPRIPWGSDLMCCHMDMMKLRSILHSFVLWQRLNSLQLSTAFN